jgi:tetratricopeptide (TPR) repeat protein
MAKIIPLFNDDFYQRKSIEVFNEAMSKISQQKYQEAADLFEEATRLDSKKAEYKFYAGITNYLIEDIEKSLFFLQEAAEMESSNMEYVYTYGMVLYRKKDFDRSIDVMSQVIENDTDHIDARLYLGKALLDMGKYKESATILSEIVQKGYQRSDVFFELGCVNLSLLQFEEAERNFQRSIALDENNILSYYYLSKTLLKIGRHDYAIEILENLRKKHPNEKELVDKNIEVINALKDIK